MMPSLLEAPEREGLGARDAPFAFSRRPRVALLVSHPIPYQVPLYRTLQEWIDLEVLYLSKATAGRYQDPGFGRALRWGGDLLEGYRYRVLGRSDRLPGPHARPLIPGLRSALDLAHRDALWLHGWTHQTTLRALAHARRAGVPVLLRGESGESRRRRGPLLRALRSIRLRHVARSASAGLAIGSRNRADLVAHGIAPRDLFSVPYGVDNAFFAATPRSEARAERWRHALHLDRAPVILTVCKLIARKRVGDLVEAHAALPRPAPWLLIAGDGERREELERQVRARGDARVRFCGFVPPADLPGLYALADVFVLASEREPWGLVANEAAAAGCALGLSDAIAAGDDLLGEDSPAGFRFPVGDVAALAEGLRALLNDPDLLQRCRAAARRRVADFDVGVAARGVLAALHHLVEPAGEANG
jgi:glycosyltransferase involved in cell wall biosynthesis